jgi:cysteinyl-tRNA synthetase
MKKMRITLCKLVIFLFAIISLSACKKDENPLPKDLDYRQEMRNFVQEISIYAKGINPNFAIIPQNGADLVSITGDESGPPEMNYINSIDGIGQEDLFYGYNEDDKKTPTADNEWLCDFLDMAKNNGTVKIMVTDYCSTQSKMDNSYSENNSKGYISFAANHRELDNIPSYPTQVYNENSDVITNLQDAKNFLYLISPDDEYPTKQAFVDAVKATNYDYIIMDFFYNEEEFTSAQIAELKQKANGGKRLLICYMSIGEAEDYRYYWESTWAVGNPSFIVKENPNWPGNYNVKYWEPEWQNIIFGNDNSYLKNILDAGFDGVYLDIIDAFEQFEQ